MSTPRLGRVPPRPFPGKPGRPRKLVPVAPDPGHTMGTPAAPARMNGGAPHRTQATPAGVLAPLTPRLVSVAGAGAYLGGLSAWAVRQLVASGRLTPVRAELTPGRPLRRLLLDVRQLEALAAEWCGR